VAGDQWWTKPEVLNQERDPIGEFYEKPHTICRFVTRTMTRQVWCYDRVGQCKLPFQRSKIGA
jgi:hypothetical protein